MPYSQRNCPPGRRAVIAGLTLAPGLARADGLRVVASFSILADMIRRIGGDSVIVTSLVPPDADAHVYQPGAADLREMAGAAVLVENGLGFEGWMARLGTASGFRGVRVTAADGVTARPGPDPHAWQNPRNALIYVDNIARGLARANPALADRYGAEAARYRAEITATDAWIAGQFDPIPAAQRRIVSTHDAFGYYGDRYGIQFLSAEGFSTEAEPSAKAIGALVALIKREKAKTVFLENMTDPRLARMLARESGATVSGPLFSDALSRPDGPARDYLTMMRYNTAWFVRALTA